MPETFKQQLVRFQAKNSADRQMIERWAKDDDRAEEAWTNIKNNIRALEAADFIKVVLKARRTSVASLARVAAYNSECNYSTEAIRKQLSTFLSSNLTLTEIADKLDQIAAQLRATEDHYSVLLPIQSNAAISRKDQSGSRARRLFMLDMGGFFLDRCSKPLDAVVMFLTDIAFPDRETTIDQVRAARRPTTSGERASSKKGGPAQH